MGKTLNKIKNKMGGTLGNIGDWFQAKSDAFFKINKQIYELNSEGLLPRKVTNILNKLEQKKVDAESYYLDERDVYAQAKENRKDTFDLLQYKNEELKDLKAEHHGKLGTFMYNFTPARWFTSVGREYQRLRKEIKSLKKEHAYWIKCSDEEKHIFEGATEQRDETRKALAEYKRIIIQRANIYRDEFKLMKEYDKINLFDKKKLENLYGAETVEVINNHLNTVTKNWYDMGDIKAPFDVKKLTKIITKLKNGEKVKQEENAFMRRIARRQEREEKEEITPEEMNVQHFSAYGIDTHVVEKIIKSYGKEPIKSFSPEQYMAFVSILESNAPEKIQKAYDTVMNGDNSMLQKEACNGAKKLKTYLTMSNEELKHSNNESLKRIADLYNSAKKEVDREETQQNQFSSEDQPKQGQSPNQGGENR